MSNRSFTLAKDNTSRRKWGATSGGQGRGTNDRLLAGKVKISGNWYKTRSFIKFTYDWSGVEVVTDATLTLTSASNSGDTELAPKSSASRIAVARLTKSFAEGSGGNWSNGDFDFTPFDTNVKAISQETDMSPGNTIEVDIIKLLWRHGPSRVSFYFGGKKHAGLGKDNHGFVIMSQPEGDTIAAIEVWSQEYGTAAARPKLDIIYEQVNTAPTATVVTPSGNVTRSFDVTGGFVDTNANDYMTAVRVQIEKNSKAWGSAIIDKKFSREVSIVDDLWHVDDGDFDKDLLKKGITYKVRAMVFDKHSKHSAYSDDVTFTITSDTPTVTAEDFGSVATLDGVLLGGAFTVDSLTVLQTVDVEVYSGSTLLWAYSRPAHQGERDSGVVRQEYGGPTLDAGAYTYKLRVTDDLDGQSTWDEGSFTLTQDAPDTEDDLTDITGYSTVPATTRIKLFEMRTSDRGPGKLKAIIEDFSNMGVSWYASSPGELFFSIPVTHPQVGACDPMVTHYQVEQYRRGRWKMLAAGLIHDFDAKENDVIVKGIDYLGLLSWSIEAAKQPAKSQKKKIGTSPQSLSGSRYANRPIRYIINDQLKRARLQDSNSPVKFILHPSHPQGGTLGSFSTKVTIYASFAQRLNFIRGLIDSHKGAVTTGGGERRSRLRVRYRKDVRRWVFDVLDNVGNDRDNIRLEYGSMLQGYQVIAMGDYANLVYGAGHEPNKLKPYFYKATAPGISQSDWGSIGNAALWQDVTDYKDLTRRARLAAIKQSRVGKRIALGLRVSGLNIWDGYDILDNIPIDIQDGVVDTTAYGSGYWTIWGGEYRVSDDGHEEVTLIVRPKGDGATIDTDLIASQPMHSQAEWSIGSGAPT